MRTMPSKEKVRTAKEMAKSAMKMQAIDELHAVGLDTTARITVEYMGISHVAEGKVTVNVDNGQIMFYFGQNTPFELEADGQEINLNARFGGNLLTRQSIENWQEIRAKYGLKYEEVVKTQTADEEELELSKAESVA